MDSAVGTRRRPLTKDEISHAFAGADGVTVPVILSPAKLAALLQMSPKTIYEWIARGYLDGTFRKRGKHILIWRDRAIKVIFDGKAWSNGK
jgi:hypothetical protein